jgi:hypothetical protein
MRRLAVLLALILVFSLVPVTAPGAALAESEDNLLTNPGAEAGDMSGWTILKAGGNGWTIDTGAGKEGTKSFATSYGWCERYQEIDLLALGYSADLLDTAPAIEIGEWFAGLGAVWMYDYAHQDYAYLRVELRDAQHKVIASYGSGKFQCPDNNGGWWGPWVQKQRVFSSYGRGLRYIYFEDGGKDREYWAGYYGTRMDAAYVYLGGPKVPSSSGLSLGLTIAGFAGLLFFLIWRRSIVPGHPEQ